MLLDFGFEGQIYLDKQRQGTEAFQAESRSALLSPLNS